MFGAILKATNCSFQKGITICRSIYVKKVMKLLAFIFEQPSYKGSSESILVKMPHCWKSYVVAQMLSKVVLPHAPRKEGCKGYQFNDIEH